MSPEQIVMQLLELALNLVEPAILQKKVDEATAIRAERAAADIAAEKKFNQPA